MSLSRLEDVFCTTSLLKSLFSLHVSDYIIKINKILTVNVMKTNPETQFLETKFTYLNDSIT